MSNDPLACGIFHRFVDPDGTIIGPDWYRAWEAKDIVGRCRHAGCDGLLVAQPNHQQERHTWYGAECLSCGHEVAARDGHTYRRSTRRTEMPAGMFEARLAILTETSRRAAA